MKRYRKKHRAPWVRRGASAWRRERQFLKLKWKLRLNPLPLAPIIPEVLRTATGSALSAIAQQFGLIRRTAQQIMNSLFPDGGAPEMSSSLVETDEELRSRLMALLQNKHPSPRTGAR